MKSPILHFFRLLFWGLCVSTCAFFSCQPEFKLDEEAFSPGMVVWSFFNPDSVFTVRLSSAQPAWSEPAAPSLGGALVTIYEDGTPVDTLEEVAEGLYQSASGMRPAVGKAYHVRAYHHGYPNISTVPDTMPIIPTLEGIAATTVPIQGNVAGQVLAIVDMRVTNRVGYSHIGSKVHFPTTGEDAFFAPPEGFACQSSLSTVEHIFFSDFGCREGRELDFRITSSNYRPQGLSQAVVSVCYASDATITFAKQLERFHELNTEIYGVDPFFEPVFLPQNVINGYGFAGCYSCKAITVNF